MLERMVGRVFKKKKKVTLNKKLEMLGSLGWMRMTARCCTCHCNTTVSKAQHRSYIVHTDFIIEFAHKISLPTEQF